MRAKAGKRHWRVRARNLAWATVAYNLIEAAACAYFGVEDGSLSLLGFGADSVLEAASGAIVLWHFRPGLSLEEELPMERRAEWLIGLMLGLTALALGLGAVLELRRGAGPRTGLAGIVISLISLAVMWSLYQAKRRTAQALKSPALRADAFTTLSCMWLSGLLLAGSLLVQVGGRPVFDAVASLGMAYLIGKEAWEHLEGEHGH